MKKCLFIGSIILLLNSCDNFSNNEAQEVNLDKSVISEKSVKVDLNKLGYNLVVNVPDTVSKTLEINQNEMGVEIFVEKKFHVAIGYDGDMALKKDDLENDGLFQNEILSEKGGFIIYKSKLPDGSKTFHHF